MREKTYWPGVWVAFVAGCLGAAHIGKVAAALVLVINELNLNLFQSSLIISLFSIVAALFGAGFGILADRIGHRTLAVAGLAICALSSLLGASASNFDLLLLTRLFEGFGFILSIVALPSLIIASSSKRHRALVMGIWGAFMPVGFGGTMLVTQLLLEWQGWRGLWIGLGWVSLGWCFVLFSTYRGRKCGESNDISVSKILQPLRTLSPWLVFFAFACYSAMFGSLTSFFPTLLVTEFDRSLESAATLGAIIVLSNALGNIAGGWLIGNGISAALVMMLAFISMGSFGFLVFNSDVEPVLKTIFGCGFSIVGGLFPAAAFALGARFALKPTHMALMAGLLLQGAGIGQSLGPMVFSALVETFHSWNIVSYFFLVTSSVGFIFGWLLLRSRLA